MKSEAAQKRKMLDLSDLDSVEISALVALQIGYCWVDFCGTNYLYEEEFARQQVDSSRPGWSMGRNEDGRDDVMSHDLPKYAEYAPFNFWSDKAGIGVAIEKISEVVPGVSLQIEEHGDGWVFGWGDGNEARGVNPAQALCKGILLSRGVSKKKMEAAGLKLVGDLYIKKSRTRKVSMSRNGTERQEA